MCTPSIHGHLMSIKTHPYSPAQHYDQEQQIRMDKLIACSCGCHLFDFFQQTEGGRANSSPSDDSLGGRRRRGR